jgi:hypothetical protein
MGSLLARALSALRRLSSPVDYCQGKMSGGKILKKKQTGVLECWGVVL